MRRHPYTNITHDRTRVELMKDRSLLKCVTIRHDLLMCFNLNCSFSIWKVVKLSSIYCLIDQRNCFYMENKFFDVFLYSPGKTETLDHV